MTTRFLCLGCGVLVLLTSVIAIHGSRSVNRNANNDEGFKLKVKKLIIDTDAGSDDAVAILLALGNLQLNSDMNIVAITCVHGNTIVDNVAANVLKILDTANRLDIPVYRGADKSLLTTPPVDDFFGHDGLGDFEYPNPPSPDNFIQKKHAALGLIDIVSTYPGEVTILCIGPLTNLALAIRLDPLFLTKVQQIVVLGGSVEGLGNVLPGIEFNFFTDPAANYILFNSTDTSLKNIKPILLYPWESVVKRHQITMEWRTNILGKLGSPQMEFLNKAERLNLNGAFWESGDSLVTATILNTSIITSTLQEYLVTHDDNQNARGAVFVDYQNSLNRMNNVIIIKEIDVDSYKSMLLKYLA